jgi:hypothetical protein
MDIGEFKRTVIVRPAVIPVPQREREPEPQRVSEPAEKPDLVPAETEK